MNGARFIDRFDAGRVLARELLARGYGHRHDVLVLALPRGGVPVGFEVAKALHAPLDVFIVRKLGVPAQPELAMGAIASGNTRVLNENVVRLLGIAPDEIERVVQHEQAELERRERDYRGSRPRPEIRGKTVILVDDGLATGSSMRAAAQALQHEAPAAIVVAVPVAAEQTCDEFRTEVDDVVCAFTPDRFRAVGLWYGDFSQTTDDQVRELLARAAQAREQLAHS